MAYGYSFDMKIKKRGFTFDDVLLIPQKTTLKSRKDVDLTTYLTPRIKLNIPIVSANMDTVTESKMAIEMARAGGIGIIHRFLSVKRQIQETKRVKKKGLSVGAAIGIKDDYIQRTEALIKAGVDVVVIDIAHGHSQHLLAALKELKKKFKKTDFVAGNVATRKGVEELIKVGADAVKVGIGPGALCTTRLIAGAGVPQLTAISEAFEVAKQSNVPVIADGGIKASGDAVKALAAGASSVMIGTLLAGCEESPALTFYKDSGKYKITRGMASISANFDRQIKDPKVKLDLKEYSAEGIQTIVPYKGRVSDFVSQFVGGIRSGFSYCGATDIQELRQKTEFIQISKSSLPKVPTHSL